MTTAFRTLLTAKTISALGSQVTIVALPLIAVLILHATPFDMGLLGAMSALPSVLFGLLAGAVIDHMPKRAVLLVTNLAAAAALAIIPLAATLHALSIPLILAVAFTAAGIASAENIALIAFIPVIVPPDRLAAANGRFGAAMSAAQVAGPAIAGALIAIVTAPGAITADALTFLAATFLMLRLPQSLTPAQGTAPETITTRLRSGITLAFTDPGMRLFTLFAVAVNFFGGGIGALEAIFIVGHLHVPAPWFATALAAGGIGAVAGALLSSAAAARFNVNALLAIAVAIGFVTGGYICTLAGAPLYVAFGFATAQAIGGTGNGLLGAAMMTYFQTAVPSTQLARLLGALTTIISASVPLGALAAGAIANAAGLRPTLILLTAGFGATLAIVVAINGKSLFARPYLPTIPR